MKIGDTVYYLDFKDHSVKQGLIYSAQPTSSGYLAYSIYDKTLFQKEAAICYDTQETALAKLQELDPIAKEIEKIAKDAQTKIDSLRKQLIGEPTLENLKELRI